GALPFTRGSTLGGPPATHFSPLKGCSQCSLCPHSPRHGIGSHNPLLRLEAVPPVQLAMQPPCARTAKPAPTASAAAGAAAARALQRRPGAGASIGDEKGAKAELASVERGELDAVVGGETEHVHLAGAAPLQIVSEPGRLAVPVVEEAAVAVDGRIRPFAED